MTIDHTGSFERGANDDVISLRVAHCSVTSVCAIHIVSRAYLGYFDNIDMVWLLWYDTTNM